MPWLGPSNIGSNDNDCSATSVLTTDPRPVSNQSALEFVQAPHYQSFKCVLWRRSQPVPTNSMLLFSRQQRKPMFLAIT